MADAFLTECIKYELDSVVWLAHRVFPSWAMVGLLPSLTASAVRTPDSMAPSIQALCVPKTKSERSGDEVRPGWRVI